MRVHDRKEFLKISGLGALTAHLFGKEVDATPAAEVEGVEPVTMIGPLWNTAPVVEYLPPVGWSRPYDEHQYSLDGRPWVTIGWTNPGIAQSVTTTPGPHEIPHGASYVRRIVHHFYPARWRARDTGVTARYVERRG
jgi:hypothetical protein